ncbi:MAG: GntR family transcriptional regulator [Phreatobacter sp.]|nr:GntR family transcriptional regulator [Phreatobacter sp.]
MTLKSGLVRVEKKSAEHQAVDNLRRFILSGGAAPGARLTEAALAGQLGVSRATTRTGM